MTAFKVANQEQQTSFGVSLLILSFVFILLSAISNLTVISTTKTSELNLDRRALNIIPSDHLCAIQSREPSSQINVA